VYTYLKTTYVSNLDLSKDEWLYCDNNILLRFI